MNTNETSEIAAAPVAKRVHWCPTYLAPCPSNHDCGEVCERSLATHTPVGPMLVMAAISSVAVGLFVLVAWGVL